MSSLGSLDQLRLDNNNGVGSRNFHLFIVLGEVDQIHVEILLIILDFWQLTTESFEEESFEGFVVSLDLHSDWGLNDGDVLNDEILHLSDQTD